MEIIGNTKNHAALDRMTTTKGDKRLNDDHVFHTKGDNDQRHTHNKPVHVAYEFTEESCWKTTGVPLGAATSTSVAVTETVNGCDKERMNYQLGVPRYQNSLSRPGRRPRRGFVG